MKKHLLLFIMVFGFLCTGLAQAPNKMNYQAVIRNNEGLLVKNKSIGIRISILKNTEIVYSERHSAVTNENGLVTLAIGEGNIPLGSISAIDWAEGPYFIKSETDPDGGSAFSITGTSE